MKLLKVVMIALVLSGGCKKKEGAETPNESAKPAGVTHPSEDDCRKLQAHIFQITPAGAEKLKAMSADDQKKAIDTFVAAVPAEDVKQCMAGDKKVIDCMQAAADDDKLKACIPQ